MATSWITRDEAEKLLAEAPDNPASRWLRRVFSGGARSACVSSRRLQEIRASAPEDEETDEDPVEE